MLLQNKIVEMHHWMLSIHAECMFCSIGDHNGPSCGWVAVPYQGFGIKVIVIVIVKAGIHRTNSEQWDSNQPKLIFWFFNLRKRSSYLHIQKLMIMISFYCFTSEKSFPSRSTHITDQNLLSPNKKGWLCVNASLHPCEITCIPKTQCENRKITNWCLQRKR